MDQNWSLARLTHNDVFPHLARISPVPTFFLRNNISLISCINSNIPVSYPLSHSNITLLSFYVPFVYVLLYAHVPPTSMSSFFLWSLIVEFWVFHAIFRLLFWLGRAVATENSGLNLTPLLLGKSDARGKVFCLDSGLRQGARFRKEFG